MKCHKIVTKVLWNGHETAQNSQKMSQNGWQMPQNGQEMLQNTTK